jgi:hypothetical protein
MPLQPFGGKSILGKDALWVPHTFVKQNPTFVKYAESSYNIQTKMTVNIIFHHPSKIPITTPQLAVHPIGSRQKPLRSRMQIDRALLIIAYCL